MLVPTILKCKIGKRLSYPVGSKGISKVFEGLPQVSKSTLSFADKPTNASRFNEILQNRDDYDILVCRIEPEGYTYPDRGSLNNISWHVTIYPVLRELKLVANEALEANGLPPFREFLLKTHRIGDSPIIPYFSVKFKPNEKTIDFWPKLQDAKSQ